MICDIHKFVSLPTIHLLLDLELYYNRQLPILRELVEDLLGVDYWVMRVITKTIVTFRYRVYTSYRASLIFNRG